MKNTDPESASIPPTATSGRDVRGELERLDLLSRALDRAAVAFRSGSPDARDAALAEGLSAVSALYGGLEEAGGSPTTSHLDRVYDACLRGLSQGYGGELLALSAAITMTRSIRSALGRASIAPRGSIRPSGPPGRIRRAA